MKLRMLQVDAFTSRLFGGNPAAVVPLEKWLPARTLQEIAMENNLAETAFFVPSADPAAADFDLRWFTPVLEISLCGHATLASAHVLYRHMGWRSDKLRFSSKSGILVVKPVDDRFELDFPAQPGVPRPVPHVLIEALGATPTELLVAPRDWMAVFPTQRDVEQLAPDMARVRAIDTFGIIVTAPGAKADFVSRFFVPRAGVDEDPATGSSHCTLVPYWAARLGRKNLHALQLSRRGGEFFCRADGERVGIGGGTVTFFDGQIELPQ
jgi:PhzF family phenazine biosynthesis protein